MNIINEKKYVFSIFMILFLTSSFVVTNDILSSAVTVFLWGLTLVVLLLCSPVFSFSTLAAAFSLIAFMWITTLVRNENIRNGFLYTFAFTTAFICRSAIGFKDFKHCYIKVMKFICCVSLVGFVIYLLIPRLNGFMVTTNMAGNSFSNLFIYVNSAKVTRNMGMFWEPGAFQTFISIALLFELLSENPNNKNIIIFSACIITTFSTTGYLSLALAFLIGMLSGKNSDKKSRAVIIVCVAIALLAIYIYKDFFFSTSKSSVFGKIITFFDRDYGNNQRITSATVRYNAIFKAIEAFFKSPVYGWGYKGLNELLYDYTHGMNTCTFANWFAVYGTLFGIIMTFGYIKLSSLIANNKLQTIMIIVFFFIITMSENYVNNASVIILALYGYRGAETSSVNNLRSMNYENS